MTTGSQNGSVRKIRASSEDAPLGYRIDDPILHLLSLCLQAVELTCERNVPIWTRKPDRIEKKRLIGACEVVNAVEKLGGLSHASWRFHTKPTLF